MANHNDDRCIDLFQTLGCTVRTPGKGSQPCTPQLDSPSRTMDIEKENDNFKNLDKDKMMAHILDCLSALKRVERLHLADGTDKGQVPAAKERVFRRAIDLIMEPPSKENENNKPDLERILQSFPDGTKLQDDRKWLPLHWAVLDDAEIDQEDIELIYSADPMALTRHHLKQLTDAFPQGFTPVHLISLQKNPKMSLVRYLDIHSPRAFVFSSRGLTEKRSKYPVQLAAAYTESIDFLQFLLQMQPGATKLGLGTFSTPLCALMKREISNFESFSVILRCLLAIDKSPEIIDEVIRRVIQKLGGKPKDSSTLLQIFEILLKANPLAATVVDNKGRLLLHYASRYLKDAPCAPVIIKALIAVHRDGARAIDADECYAITTAAQYSSVEIVSLLHAAYPDATMIDEQNPKRNIIHNGLYNLIDENMMTYLCGHFPEALHGYSQDRKTPLHELCYQHAHSRFRSLRTMCDVDPSIARKECAVGAYRLGIPLHLLIIGDAKSELKSPTSDAADCFRYLLRLYPESAGIRDLDGNTSYTLAVILHMKPYFIRLILKADITIDPAVLRTLNYKERRGAMFLAFSAVSSNRQPSLFAMLRKANVHLLEIVFSYL